MRLSKRILARSVISEVDLTNDARPHAEVVINGIRIVGLLDSGASISCFGKDAVGLAEKLGLKI